MLFTPETGLNFDETAEQARHGPGCRRGAGCGALREATMTQPPHLPQSPDGPQPSGAAPTYIIGHGLSLVHTLGLVKGPSPATPAGPRVSAT